MKDQLLKLRDEALAAIAGVSDAGAIQEMRVRYLGKKSELSRVLGGLGKLPTVEERRAMGALGNEIKQAITQALDAREAELAAAELEARTRPSASTSPCRARRCAGATCTSCTR